MGITNKPSNTSKYKPTVKPTPPMKFDKFNKTHSSRKIKSHTEEELFEILERKLSEGWYQVSDIFKEVGGYAKELTNTSDTRKIKGTRKLNYKTELPDVYFVYVSRNKPRGNRKFKKAY